MDTIDPLRDRLAARFPGAGIVVVNNPGPSGQHSLLLGHGSAREIAEFLRDDPELQLDYCSNVSGVDWPAREISDVVKSTIVPTASNQQQRVEQRVKRLQPGYLEVVYHLYSMALRTGPVILRLRTGNRSDQIAVPSLTPVWRSCEFQEREVYDLFGIVFSGHPDLRRILMWDEFKDHPLRKDYVEPDDYEWEPTPHDDVLKRAKAHYPAPSKTPSS